MKYQAYPEYKSSGIEWLGDVPKHWDVKRLRFVAEYKNSNVDKKSYEDQKEVRLCNYTDVYYNEFISNDMDFMIATASDTEIKSMSLKRGDVIITKDSEDPRDIGIPAIVAEELDNVVCGYHLTIISSNNLDSNRFLHRVIQSEISKFYFLIMSPGMTRYGLNQNSIGNTVIPFPTTHEQKAIADFLDTETTRIDNLIEEKEHFIELLEEKRQALITHAVTKGLDANTTMKSSGNEWLGDVPEHWTVKRLKFVIQLNPSKSEVRHLLEDGIDVSFLPMELVNEDGTYQLTENRNINDVYSGFTYCMDDDVILAKITPCFENGKGALLKGLTNSIAFGSTEFHVLRPVSSVGKFVWYLTKTNLFGEIGKTEMKGAVGQQRIPSDFVENFYFAQPSLDEQQDIVDYLDTETQKIDDIIKETSHSIDLLKEHRTALISAAVTGKIDVRHLVKEAA